MLRRCRSCNGFSRAMLKPGQAKHKARIPVQGLLEESHSHGDSPAECLPTCGACRMVSDYGLNTSTLVMMELRVQMLAYLEAYVDHFGFRKQITFRTHVVSVIPQPKGGFTVSTKVSHIPLIFVIWSSTRSGRYMTDSTADGRTGHSGMHSLQPAPIGASVQGLALSEGPLVQALETGKVLTRHYTSVIVACGHHWDPLWPKFKGTFRGSVSHSHAYRTPEPFVGKRVMVIGGGNSGTPFLPMSTPPCCAAAVRMLQNTRCLPAAAAGLCRRGQ